MNKIFRAVFLWSTILVFTGNVWALPIEGGLVTMEADSTLPYVLTDLSDGQVYSSFCLEYNNFFTSGTTYQVASVGDIVTGGGTTSLESGDPLDVNTKWLYAAYMSGVFGDDAETAQLVQEAIWFLENEEGGSWSAWETLSDYTFDDTGWTVVAVNIISYDQDGTVVDNQSQLIGTAPVPEPATMLLMGTGLIVMAGLGRRKLKLQK